MTSALIEKRVKIAFVTHLTEFARGWFEENRSDTAFLVAERRESGERTFRIIEGSPQGTSFGKDLYFEVFGKDIEGSERQDDLNEGRSF